MAALVTYKFIKKADPALLREIISLYKSQGWAGPKDGAGLFSRLIRGSHCFIAAMAEGNAVGMGRALSDGASDGYIQDVFVLPRYRGLGLGSAIVLRLKARLLKDGVRWVGLVAQDNSERFYGALGFKAIKRSRAMMLKGNRV